MFDPLTLALTVGTGLVAGVLAGLLGIGGGVVIVPALLVVFTVGDVDPAVRVQLAVGTSLATIVFTSLSSAAAHHRRGALHLRFALGFVPGLVAGAVGGASAAVWMPGEVLQLVFGAFLMLIALWMVFGRTPEEPRPRRMRPVARLAAGLVIGGVSAVVGIGGGVMSVPLFVLAAGMTIHHAVGTAPALGLVLSLVGTVTFVIQGWSEPALPPGTAGYVALIPAAVIAGGTVVCAPLGARLAHRLPRRALERAFAVLLVVVAVRLVLDAGVPG
ncbi:MAG: sulfite exporter TauE/SafE family protein [Myxococcota bacterium]|nr:sulfite exporter TauE/SafE family protein [Myxococcota bacterium]